VTLESNALGSKQSQFEISSEPRELMILRFLIHFLYTQHQARDLPLFDKKRVDKLKRKLNPESKKTNDINEVIEEEDPYAKSEMTRKSNKSVREEGKDQ